MLLKGAKRKGKIICYGFNEKSTDAELSGGSGFALSKFSQ